MYLKRALTELAFARVMTRCRPFAFTPDASSTRPHKRSNASSVLLPALRAFQRARRRRATIRFLEELNDDVLKDIGLHRSEIRSLVHHPDDRFPRLKLDV